MTIYKVAIVSSLMSILIAVWIVVNRLAVIIELLK